MFMVIIIMTIMMIVIMTTINMIILMRLKTLRANPLSEVGQAVIAALAFALPTVPDKDIQDNYDDDEMVMHQNITSDIFFGQFLVMILCMAKTEKACRPFC